MTRVANPRALGALLVALLLVAGVVMSFSGGAAAQSGPLGGTFTDDDGNVHEENIEAIAAEGITAGCDATGTLYCPSDFVTRAQMASFLARALDLPASSTDWFPDDDGSPHEANINAIAEAGITLGLADGTYNPSGLVRRDQMASFIERGIPGLTAPSMDYFTDDTGNVHEAAINTMAENAITLGCDASGTLYCPSDNVRRDQMASFLARGLGLDPIPTTTTTDGGASTTVGDSSTTSDASTTSSSGATTSSSGATTSSSGATTSSSTTTTTMGDTETVDVLDNVFSPSNLTIDVGDTVEFSKQTGGNHNVNFDDASIPDSGSPTTATFNHPVTFTTAGVYTYRCDIHSGIGMTGTITVNS